MTLVVNICLAILTLTGFALEGALIAKMTSMKDEVKEIDQQLKLVNAFHRDFSEDEQYRVKAMRNRKALEKRIKIFKVIRVIIWVNICACIFELMYINQYNSEVIFYFGVCLIGIALCWIIEICGREL